MLEKLCQSNWLERWRGALILAVVAAVIAAATLYFEWPAPRNPSTGTQWFDIFLLIIVVEFTALGIGLLITFFWVFQGIEADEELLDKEIGYCYAFIVFALSATIIPFVALNTPRFEPLIDTMKHTPVGIVLGCVQSTAPSNGSTNDQNRIVPSELSCTSNQSQIQFQWLVNIGGGVQPAETASGEHPANSASPSVPGVPPSPVASATTNAASAIATAPSGTEKNPPPPKYSKITGGLVVPLYAIVLALMGATVSMTRRVPEYQRRLYSGDGEHMTYEQARESLVFQIMQVASAPLIVVTAYYLVDPKSPQSTIFLSFASGFSSETILLMIRAFLEKLKPVSTSAPKSLDVKITPDSVDFDKVTLNTPSKKSVTVSNPGPVPLTISQITCSGGEFLCTTATPVTVSPNSHADINITFTPTKAGSQHAQVVISDNATGSPRTIELRGTGVEPQTKENSVAGNGS